HPQNESRKTLDIPSCTVISESTVDALGVQLANHFSESSQDFSDYRPCPRLPESMVTVSDEHRHASAQSITGTCGPPLGAVASQLAHIV
ncbi:MAG: hypothetical protein ABW224_17980, partial [Kibdelosporangium sp.]